VAGAVKVSCLRVLDNQGLVPLVLTRLSTVAQGAVRRGGKMLVLRQPRDGGPFLLSRQPLPELVASLQSSSVACQQWATALGAVGISMLAVAGAQHVTTYLRRRRLRQRVEKALRDRAAAGGTAGSGEAAAGQAAGETASGGQNAAAGDGGGADGEVGGRGLCVICLERPSDTVFPSCGHMCACSSCSGGLRRCPICRSRGAPIRVFTS
jgi:E3 ubiquitin-protein ligase MUL1